MSTPRPKSLLTEYGKSYPHAWRQVDELRQGKGKDLPDWPSWCFLPLAGAHAIVTNTLGNPLSQAKQIGIFGALAAWRVTQGIYRFDSDLYASVIDTPLNGDIPCNVLYQLPEWCVYVETPGLSVTDIRVYGFFAYLEHDINTGRPELRLVIDSDSISQIILHLGKWSLQEAISKAQAEGRRQAVKASMSQAAAVLSQLEDTGMNKSLEELATPCLNLLLFLCSQAGEVGTPEHRPENPKPKWAKKAWRLFPARNTTTWDVGVRIGAELRRGQAAASERRDATGQTVRPHMRRAHWHGYWKGPRDPEKSDQRRYDLKWLPPTPVNMSGLNAEDLPAVIRPVQNR